VGLSSNSPVVLEDAKNEANFEAAAQKFLAQEQEDAKAGIEIGGPMRAVGASTATSTSAGGQSSGDENEGMSRLWKHGKGHNGSGSNNAEGGNPTESGTEDPTESIFGDFKPGSHDGDVFKGK
jgi:hypothetical protein